MGAPGSGGPREVLGWSLRGDELVPQHGRGVGYRFDDQINYMRLNHTFYFTSISPCS